MNYNDNGEAFETIKHFIVQKDGEDVHKFRIRFLRSRHEQIVGVDELKSGEFRDESKIKDTNENTLADIGSYKIGIDQSSGEDHTVISGTTITVPEATIALEVNEETIDNIIEDSVKSTSDNTIENEHKERIIKATFVKTNKSQLILDSLLRQFVADNKLDAEAVVRCLNGEQKTHKGWTFNESN
jgi:hypothetical protein